MPKKTVIFLLVVLFCFAGLTACTGPSDLTKGKTAEQIAEEAFDRWYGLDNYDMNMNMFMKMNIGGGDLEMTMTSEATIFQDPLKMKMTANVSMPMLVNESMTIEQYALTENEQFVIYQKVEDLWQKIVADDSTTKAILQTDPKDNLKLFMDSLEKAEILAEEKIEQLDTVKLELVASGKIFDQIMEQTAGNPLGVNGDLFDPAIFTQIGDLKYILWIDKATLNVVKGQMDLSENMRNLGAALTADPNMPAEMKEMFAGMEMVADYTITNHNKAQDFTLPEEAKNAEEIIID